MAKTLLKLVLLLLASFLAIEQSYRVSQLGLDAFSITRLNSYNQIILSDYIRLSEFPEVYYELRPNIDAWFHGKRFRTNSAGLADKEYSREKPDNTFRVAVIGSSWTMATDVETEKTWHAVLEERLNERYPGKRFEFINFGVEYYGLRELVATVRHKALDWEPDLIHVDLTSFTCYLLWEPPKVDQALPAKVTPMLQSYVLQRLNYMFDLGLIPDSMPERPTVGYDMALNDDQALRALNEIKDLAEPRGIEVSLAWLSFNRPGKELERRIIELAQQREITYSRVYEVLLRPYVGRSGLSVANKHPDAEDHELMAAQVWQDLSASKLLPRPQLESM